MSKPYCHIVRVEREDGNSALFGTFDTPEEANAWITSYGENDADVRCPDRVRVLVMNRAVQLQEGARP